MLKGKYDEKTERNGKIFWKKQEFINLIQMGKKIKFIQ